MSLKLDDIKKYRKALVWKTMEGEQLKLAEMKTSHVFNSAKMIFNHLAEAHGGQPIWFKNVYPAYQIAAKHDPNSLVKLLAAFCLELEHREDLDERYKQPYGQIKGNYPLTTSIKELG